MPEYFRSPVSTKHFNGGLAKTTSGLPAFTNSANSVRRRAASDSIRTDPLSLSDGRPRYWSPCERYVYESANDAAGSHTTASKSNTETSPAKDARVAGAYTGSKSNESSLTRPTITVAGDIVPGATVVPQELAIRAADVSARRAGVGIPGHAAAMCCRLLVPLRWPRRSHGTRRGAGAVPDDIRQEAIRR